MTLYCVVCARSFQDTGEIISGNAVRLSIVETFLLPYRLLKHWMRGRKNKALAKKMARVPQPEAEETTTHQLRPKRKASRHGTVMNILHDDDLEAELESLEAGETVVEAYVDGVSLQHGQKTAERSAYDTFDAAVVPDPVDEKPARTPSSDSQQTPETEPDKSQPRRCGKRWWKQQLAELWYITRKEHPLIGMIAPLHEELAVLTRFQGLLCYYVETQLALASVALFLGTSQTAVNAGIVALISILVVSPADLLLPYMFTTSQTLVSTTVRISREYRRSGAAPQKRKRSFVSSMPSIVGKLENQAVVVPFSKDVADVAQQTLTELFGGSKHSKVVPAALVKGNCDDADAKGAHETSSPKMGWLSAGKTSNTTPVKTRKERKASAFAAKMLLKRRSDMEVRG